MLALPGVGDVAFDCKTATVTMKGDATLAQEVATKALIGADAAFGVKSFSGGPPPTDPVVRARISDRGGDAATPAQLASLTAAATMAELVRELGAAELLIEPDGRLTARGKPDEPITTAAKPAKLDGAALTAALARRGFVIDEVKALAWPRSAAGYVAALRGAVDASGRAKARAAIETIENVLAAIERPDGSFLVFTKEPCDNLEVRLREALKPTALVLERVAAR